MIQIEDNITNHPEHKTLKDFIPLVMAFFGGLVVLSIYQHIRLYSSGVLDSFVNKSFFLLLLHHIGFAAVVAVVLSFLFNFLERKKPKLGFKVVWALLVTLLLIEGLLVEYYVQKYEILGLGIFNLSIFGKIKSILLLVLVILGILGTIFHYLHKVIAPTYTIISRMYPFTVLLFSFFLATLNSNKKPINENKTQHLILSIAHEVFDFNKYEGEEEYPLLKPYEQHNTLGAYFDLKKERPNVVLLIVEGLGSDFVGDKAIYKGFTPFLESLTHQSLYWENYVSNTGNSFAALPSIMGSLPFGENGFTNIEGSTNRHTLYSILKDNGYATYFNYGGNSALDHMDKFLDEEHVDVIMDRSGFGDDYNMQSADAAGISLGYPDKELFRKWSATPFYNEKPRLEVFLTLSSKKPFLIPKPDSYENRVEAILSKTWRESRLKKLIKKNKEVFASMIYTDEAIALFFNSYKDKPEFNNTIFLIVGSHNVTDLPQRDELGRYRVPLMIYSPLLKTPQRIRSLASHADVAPTLVSLLDEKYQFKIPGQVAWLGENLLTEEIFDPSKKIPLFRNKNDIQDYIDGQYFLSGDMVYKLNDRLKLMNGDDAPTKKIKNHFKYFKAVNNYVAVNNKIIPESEDLFPKKKNEFTKQELVWINSVFNGTDFDNAYMIARELAIHNKKERALLLCRYILFHIPRHADTEILMGRVYGWQGNYDMAIQKLEEAVKKYPLYADVYAALLDVYFWADENKRAIPLYERIKNNKINTKEVNQKMARAHLMIKKKDSVGSSNNLNNNPKIGMYIASTN